MKEIDFKYILLNGYLNVSNEDMSEYLVESCLRWDKDPQFVDLFFTPLLNIIDRMDENMVFRYYEELNNLHMFLDNNKVSEDRYNIIIDSIKNIHIDQFYITDPHFNKIYFSGMQVIKETIKEVVKTFKIINE